MRVLGYGFRGESAAARARDALVERYRMGPDDAKVAELAEGAVLAVRAPEENVDGVTAVVAELGGEPLTNVDERWTGLRTDQASTSN